jgi:CHRD domain
MNMRMPLILVAAAAAATAASPLSAQTAARLSANLTGAAEVPGPGKTNASGSAVVRVNAAQRRVCYTVNFRNIPNATMAHIHAGARGVAGPPVVTLNRAGPRAFEGCTRVGRQLARDLVDRPRQFYVNVHSAAFPDGAVRGQLRR